MKLTNQEKAILAKYEQAQTRWWLLSPRELDDLERKAKAIYAKMEGQQ